MRRIVVCLCMCFTIILAASSAFAGLGSNAFNYGFGARGLGMGMAYTALSNDSSNAFFNPAMMAMLPRSELAFSYIYAQPEFQGGPKGNTFAFDASNRVVQFNWVAKLNSIFKTDRDIAIGLNVALDDNGAAFIRFYDAPNPDGYYYLYGPAGFVLNPTLGFGITEWLYLGGGVVTTLHGESGFSMNTDLTGKTTDEGTTLDSDVVFSPLLAMNFHSEFVDIAATWHGRVWGQLHPITVEAAAQVGESELAELPMELYFRDNYHPHRIALGTFWRPTDWIGVSADVAWYNWRDFGNLIETEDNPRNDVKVVFKDIFEPHIGLEFEAVEHLFLRTGYSFRDTPVDRPGNSEHMILDSPKHVATCGFGFDWQNPPLLSAPVRLDAAYFFHYLMDHELISTDRVAYESSGILNGGAATLTLRY